MTGFAVHPETIKAAVAAALGDRALRLTVQLGEVTVVVRAADYLAAATQLRDASGCKFEQLIDLCGVDYSEYSGGGADAGR